MVSHTHQYETGHYFHVHEINSEDFARTGAVVLPPEIGTADNMHFHPAFLALEEMLAGHEREALRQRPEERFSNDG